ncbi:MAG: amino acid adenylation domain-containing protein, partial [Chloroflexi bacterium]|nr:amino acid adenylation domain-containing protein [Chloroflexota bacterium]
LNGRANQLAHFLRELGAGPEALVAICVRRSLDMAVGLLGILKAGAAYLPLDPTYPRERLAFMLADANPTMLLTQTALSQRLPRHHARVIQLDADWQAIAQHSQANPRSGVNSDNLAYVLYTSGSTGKPKGTLVPHRGLTNYLSWCQRAYPLTEGDGSLVQSSISFDLTITSFFAPLLAGRTVRLLPEEADVETLARGLAERSNLSLVKITPAHLQLLGQQLSRDEAADRTRAFIIGGENLLLEHIDFWQRHAPDTALVNEYGPTETVVGCCVYRIPRGTHQAGIIPIGRAITNVQLYLLDRHLQPVPIGVPGELYIGGDGVARGYLNRPELTEEKFIPDPFSRDPVGARHAVPQQRAVPLLYRTGDLARYLPDGNLECLGRTDQQVKIRGFRVELGEIEAALTQHPGVEDGVVLAREDNVGDKRLVAYLVPQNGAAGKDSAVEKAAPSVDELRSFLRDTLPDYMIPSVFVVLEALPLTPNGKIDRQALPAPDGARPELDHAFVAPRNPAEQALAGIWARLLGVDRVGVHDNFFALGGDSILSIQVVARAKQAGVHLMPRHIFQHPTIAELAEVSTATRQVEAEQGTVTGPVPLTPIQSRFFESVRVEPHHWNSSILVAIPEPLDIGLLEQALGHLLEHHDALRLRCWNSPSGWEQRIVDFDGRVPLTRLDLSTVDQAQQRAAVEEAAAEAQASLNLAEGPVLRMVLMDLGPDQPQRLLVVFHHLVTDGVSLRIFSEDLQRSYSQLKRGEPVQLPLKTSSYPDWARRLVEYAQSPELRQEAGYWMQMASRDLARLPVDYTDGINTYGSVARLRVSLTQAQTLALLRDMPSAHGVQINEVLLTALVETIARWTGRRAVLVEMEGHGREDIFVDLDLSRTIGWFTSIYPVLLEAEQDCHPLRALHRVAEQLRAIPGRGIGYGLLSELCEDATIREQLKALPKPEVSINYLGQFDQPGDESLLFLVAGESAGPEQSPRATRDSLIDIVGIVASGGLDLLWTYSTARHRHSTIERLAGDYIAELRRLIDSCLGVTERSGDSW